MIQALRLFGNRTGLFAGKTAAKKMAAAPAAISKDGMKRLELMLPFRWPDTDKPVKWCVTVANEPEQQGQVSDLQDLDGQYAALPLTVYVDAADAVIMQAELPEMSRKHLAKAIPYALEDRLLGDVEQQFFTWKHHKEAETSVCVMAHDRIRSVLEALKSHRLEPDILTPVVFSAPMLENSWTLVFDAPVAWLRTGATAGAPCLVENAEPPYALTRLLDAARASETAPTGLLLINPPESIDSRAWSSQLQLEMLIPEGRLWENMDRNGKTPINLLQGPYTVRSSRHGSLRRLLPAAILASLFVLGNGGLVAWEWIQLRNQASSIKQDMVRIFTQSFPGQTAYDPAGLMQKNLELLRQKNGGAQYDDFLPMLGPTSKALADSRIDGLTNIRYRDGHIMISVQLGNYQDLDRLKAALGNNHLNVEVMEANSDNTGVSAKLKLSRQQGAAS